MIFDSHGYPRIMTNWARERRNKSTHHGYRILYNITLNDLFISKGVHIAVKLRPLFEEENSSSY
jgi:hypothetical protein